MAGDADADRKYDAMIDMNEEEQMWVIDVRINKQNYSK